MRSVPISVFVMLNAVPASAEAPRGPAVPQPVLTDAVYVRPLYGGPYRHCGGGCLKSGTLSWFCSERQQCVLNCAVAPPSRKCAIR